MRNVRASADAPLAQTHLPGYVADAEALRAAGAQIVACVSVNDPFVMAAWGDAHGAADKARAAPATHGATLAPLAPAVYRTALLSLALRC